MLYINFRLKSPLQIDKYKAKGALKEIGIAKVGLEEFLHFIGTADP